MATVARRPPAAKTPAAKPIEKVGTARVSSNMKSKQMGDYGHIEREEEVLIAQFNPGEEPARVDIGIGQTISTGQFEFLRIDVRVTIPCLNTEAAIEATYTKASDFAAKFVESERVVWLGE